MTSLKSYNYQSATLAFILWSSWAYVINIDSDNKMLSALSQGVASFIITLVIIKIILFFYTLLPQKRLFFVLPSLITVSITSSCLVLIHVIVETKNIFFTVLPTVVVALLFGLFTTQKISTYLKKE